MDSMQSGLRRRRLGMAFVVSVGLGLAGCGGGDLDPLDLVDGDSDGGGSSGGEGLPLHEAFLALQTGMSTFDVEDQMPGSAPEGTASQVMRWETDAETVEVRFIGSTIFEADWTERSTGSTEHRSFIVGSGGSGSPQTLYDTYVALRSGMTKSEVVALAPVVPSQGSDTEQVLWVLGEEALGVMFNGVSNSSVISFAQWGLSIAAGGQTESRSF